MGHTKIDKGCVVRINPRIYSLRVIYSGAYLFLNKAYIFLDEGSKGEILVKIQAKRGGNSKRLAGEFKNSLLNAALRYQIAKENKKIRELIVGSALINVSEEPEEQTEECGCRGKKLYDPHGIAVTWEEKYAKSDKGPV
jgi:His-Xaa-Ser system protein HxsD